MSDISQTEREFRRQTNLGTIAAGGGYLFWGLSVLYYRQIDYVSPLEILAHRALWSLLLTYGFIIGLGRWSKLVAVLRNRRAMGTLCLSGLIIGSNWAVFIWAVNSGRILETSLAYFINPLVSVLTGVVLLGERIWLAQKIAIALACVGVLYSTFALGFVPWISLFLAFSFAAYGYLKKTLRVDALEGLFVEVLVLTPLALIYLAWLSGHGGSSFMQGDWFTDLFLALAGPMTTVPLLLFTYGAQRIRLTTLGLLQYLVPTASFTIAVWVYGEPLGQAQLVTFAFIWTGLVIFTFDTWRRDRALKRGIPA
jgi:chloramphenicol-sensitive protein RarD